MDALKTEVADKIHGAVREQFRVDTEVRDANVEVVRLNTLETVVRVPSHNGPRYFNVRVSESV